ncbi:hypothetical protein [Maritimibacter fusiformis]|uniref:Transferrin-binding protein B C-lobe/N-lobe beta barrel domain-containing protein n=1 Tax=Maritimibacter fusiformis TaxID=2603819 RepID=A0A5D0RLC5_9RHOB|nr:hypothetical protein [Maritimibacter fusiformis]TYB82440.1 hypothetical protein FVF75_06920 [Maritimibacter fusiformis]
MIRQTATLLAALSLAACLDGKNPLVDTGPAPDDPNALDLPPGTERPTSRTTIERHEGKEDGTGNGYAESITYDPVNDTFTVDNLAFDGGNTYSRDTLVPNLGAFRVYENDGVYFDDVTGNPILQFMHRAIIDEGASGKTHVAIVRTGAYVGYGFGGFLYSRDGGVDIPATGQAIFAGDYSGIRDFNGKGGLEYVTGNATAQIDFEDFNDGDGVLFMIRNRKVFNAAGVDITASLSPDMVADLTNKVGPQMANEAGEISLRLIAHDGAGTVFGDAGVFYGLLAGQGADMELVGVVVVGGTDSRDGFEYRETGGVILER